MTIRPNETNRGEQKAAIYRQSIRTVYNLLITIVCWPPTHPIICHLARAKRITRNFIIIFGATRIEREQTNAGALVHVNHCASERAKAIFHPSSCLIEHVIAFAPRRGGKFMKFQLHIVLRILLLLPSHVSPRFSTISEKISNSREECYRSKVIRKLAPNLRRLPIVFQVLH